MDNEQIFLSCEFYIICIELFGIYRVYLVDYPFGYIELSPIFLVLSYLPFLGFELSPIFWYKMYWVISQFCYWVISHFFVLIYLPSFGIELSPIFLVLSYLPFFLYWVIFHFLVLSYLQFLGTKCIELSPNFGIELSPIFLFTSVNKQNHTQWLVCCWSDQYTNKWKTTQYQKNRR